MRDSRVAAFENLMRWATCLEAANNRAGLEDLIKIVLRPVQSIHMREALLRPRHHGPHALHWMSSLGGLWDGDAECGTWAGFLLKHCRCPVDECSVISLASDMVIPTLWSESSILNSLGMIGKGRKSGEFMQDKNHSVTLMRPMNIVWVNGGNHSIAQGILGGEGELLPDDVYDVTEIIKGVRFDGELWICQRTGEKLGSPIYAEFGWAWEIARFLINLPSKPTGYRP
ncbi:hypothetical protein E6B08_23210 [Pseudomonas putida]|uniref:Uncharacterized protein n=1 Tax=Pseudomonas putida TaxID=303 RepID=A0A4D6XMM6_PSEPU|nr:DUF6710 family protein [Pseudomonas putida]QCI14075.1 hypothetical protein E6B08_23210 [Pseudomonas putida]